MKKKKISRKTRAKISRALKKYWKSYEGKKRKHEYFRIPEGKAKEFREKEKVFRSKTRGEYDVRLYARQPKGGYKQVPIEKFRKGHKYLVYLVHRSTRRSRLLASGTLYELPIASLRQTREFDSPIITSSRRFNPLKKGKARGNWLPIQRFYNKALKNIETQKKALKENYRIRGTILPLKRYYNPELMLFADEPIKRGAIIREGFAHVVVAFDYPNIRWISGRHIKVEFARGIRADEIKDKIEKIEDLAEDALLRDFPKAHGGVKVLMVDGFIPTKFGGANVKKRRARKSK